MLTLEEASKFHGHLGPFLLLGFKAGSLGRELVGASNDKELEALVMVPLRTPFSCIIDGVQCSTGCTLGKLNIKASDSPRFEVIIRNKRNGKEIIIKIKREVIDRLKGIKDMKEAVKLLRSMNISEIFEISIQPPREEYLRTFSLSELHDKVIHQPRAFPKHTGDTLKQIIYKEHTSELRGAICDKYTISHR